jgi:hypothetical protein
VTRAPLLLLCGVLATLEPPSTAPTPPDASREGTSASGEAPNEAKPPRPDDKTLVAALDVMQGVGKDRVSLYVDGTLALVRTYEGVRTLKFKRLSEEEVDLVRRICTEAMALDEAEYHTDILGRGEPRRFRVEIGRADDLPRVFLFDELARVPLVLGRARNALEELLARFDEKTVSEDDLWDPAGLAVGDVLIQRTDGKRYRIVRDDAFVRSLEMIEVERTLQRLLILREDVPKIFHRPTPGGEGGSGP